MQPQEVVIGKKVFFCRKKLNNHAPHYVLPPEYSGSGTIVDYGEHYLYLDFGSGRTGGWNFDYCVLDE
jgi:hypothetical protein